MAADVTLTFRYSQDDYVRAVRAHQMTRLRLWLDLLAITVAMVLGIYLWPSPKNHWLGLCLIIGAGVLALMLLAVMTVIPVWLFRSEPKFCGEYRLVFSAEGLHFQTANIDSHLKWSTYTRALVDARSCLLYYSERQFTIVPKRVFESAEQREAFEQLLTAHVPTIVRRGV